MGAFTSSRQNNPLRSLLSRSGQFDKTQSAVLSTDSPLAASSASGKGWLSKSSSSLGQHVNALSNSRSTALKTSHPTSALPRSGFDSGYGYGLVDSIAAIGKARQDNFFSRNRGNNNFPNPNAGGRSLWGLEQLNTSNIWQAGYTGEGVVVAVLDTGVDINHIDLSKNIWKNSGEVAGNGIDDDGNGFIDDVNGWDFAYSSNQLTDVDGHGTHVAGTIAGVNNGFGVTGVAYDATIMPVKVLDDSGSGSNGAIAKGIRYAVDNGADVINLSLGGSYSKVIERAVRYAVKRGSTVVMASGNESMDSPIYPAQLADKWGIAVGAVDRNLRMADFSNLAGDTPIDYVVAPGVNIYSTYPGDRYKSLDGTSMATPHVSGLVALMLEANPNLTPQAVENILTSTANPDGVRV